MREKQKTKAELVKELRQLRSCVSELRKAEDELRKSEQQFKDIFENTAVGMYRTTPDGKILMANPALVRMLGFSSFDELSQRNLEEEGFEPCYSRSEFKERMESQGQIVGLESQWVTRDGTRLVVIESARSVRDGSGRILYYEGTAEDITERKKAAEELRIRNQILDIFLTIPDEQMYSEILNVVLKALRSEYGTFGYFNEDGSFTVPAITREIYWEKCNVPGKEIIFQRGAFSGIWREAIKEKRTLHSNKGPFNTPEGHIPIKNTMVTPIYYRDKLLSAIHVANKPTDYDERDKALLQTIANHIAPVLYARLEREKEERDRKEAEEEKEKLLSNLDERVKELNCLYGLSKLVEKPDISLENVFQSAASLIPPAWQYPDITCATILFEDKKFRTDNFKTSKWRQSQDIKVHGKKVGSIEVYYLQERPEVEQGPFSKEERELLHAIAERLGRIIERKQAERRIRELNEELEQRVRERTAELTEAHKKLLQDIDERRRMEKDILDISEREQRRIGQELHDSLGQQLTGIAIMSKVLEQKLKSKSIGESAEAQEIGRLLNQAAEQTRRLAKGLHPVDLDASGLMSALQELAVTTEQLFGIRCTFDCDEPVPIDDAAVAVHLYRIAQEAVTNAIKHGHAENIVLRLAPDRDMLTLTIESDGLDFPEAPPKNKGMGLHIMDYRAEMIDGTLDVHRGARGGTIVTCAFADQKTGQE